MLKLSYRPAAVAAAFVLLCCSALHAQNLVRIDATAAVPAPQPVAAKLGSATNPQGETLGVNSQYLTRNGKPWLPVMGEFHFSRYPQTEWEEEILKMKAAGVDIISSYIIWIHHEQIEGKFDWSGQRDLRRFAQLCAKHGMYFYPRIGPWSHAEVRNGGLPDWVLKNGPTRQNDPVYLAEVQTFFQQIAVQLHGMLWKDGGTIIGLQIENEYKGGSKGADHIRTLKKMAIDDGLDVPFYTVTGWDKAVIPLDAALPVFGGYPDAPWDGAPHALPPNEVYAFRFGNRSAGSMGMIGSRSQSPADTYRGTPFLTAEVGDGTEDTYVRRPVLTPDDVASIVPVMLGSGANLLGYYMFHGGRNPEPEPANPPITLQESQATGYPTDVPTRSYDFQAPLGEFGQTRESLRKLKLVHYFLADFGPELAPMEPRSPAAVPSGPADVSVVRVAARTRGDAGFLFLNNHVRAADVPARPGFQVELILPGGAVHIPQEPFTLPAGAYGIWPVNLPLASPDSAPTTLRYATAQLFLRVPLRGETWYFLFALPGVQPELAFAPDTAIEPVLGRPAIDTAGDLRRVRPDPAATTELRLPGKVHVVVMPEADAEQVWRGDDSSELVSTSADAFANAGAWTLDSTVGNTFRFGLFGVPAPLAASATLQPGDTHGLFTRFDASVPPLTLTPVVTSSRAAGVRQPAKLGPAVSWRPHPTPMAPDDTDFASTAAAWTVQVPPVPAGAAVSDAFLTIPYQGDVARLLEAGHTVDDNFWNGLPWQVGLRETDPSWRSADTTYTVQVLPLRQDTALYLEESGKLHFDASGPHTGQDVMLGRITVVPQYRLRFQLPQNPSPARVLTRPGS